MIKLLILLTALLLPMVASADAVEIDGIYYNLSKGQLAEVTSNPNEYSGEIVIPSNFGYNGVNYSVISIGDKAFQNCLGLTSVTIPNSVTSIGYDAFDQCKALTSITIPNSVTSIGSSAFDGCSGLTSVIIPNSVTSIGDWAFYGCSGLTSVTIGKGVTSIETSTFRGCSRLTSITIPNSVTSIGDWAFYGCSGLTSITIPNSVTVIGYGAFYNCKGLTSLVIPNSVTDIGSEAFHECRNLTSVNIGNGVKSIDNFAFALCTGLTSVHITDLESWCKISFEPYSSNPLVFAQHLYLNEVEITQLVIPNSLTYIGSYAFENCKGLTSVTIPSNVTSIGREAFANCSNLNTLTIPNSVTSIGTSAFSGCSSLTTVTIPNSVTNIGTSAFAGCNGLKTVTIGTGIKTINLHSFANCQELTDVYSHAKTVPTTSTNAFEDSYQEYITLHVPAASIDLYKAAEPWMNFKEIVAISEQQPTEENIIFADANVKSICVANWDTNDDGELSKTEAAAVTDIGTVFKEKTNITSFNELQYFTGLTVIGFEAFYNCSNLSSVVIPNNVVKIKQNAFLRCANLVSITFPENSGFEIEEWAFQRCTSLQSILFPQNLTTMNGSPFRNCPSLTQIEVDDANPNFKALDGVLYSKDGRKIVAYPCGRSATEYEIEEGTLTIGSSAFCGASKIEQINIPNSVTQILFSAFSYCSCLKVLKLPINIVSIPNYMAESTGITEIVIPGSVTSIGEAAFNNCSSLTSVTVEIDTPLPIISSTFSNRKNATLYVPKGSKEAYLSANYWKDFMEIVEISEQQPTEDNIIFSDANVKAICVSNWDTNGDGELSKTEAAAVTDIGTVFKENTNITSFDELQYFIGLTSIDWRAFRDCTALSTIIIPASVSVINNGAFRGCTNMSTIYVDVNNNNYKSINGVLFTKDGKQLLLFPSKQEGAYAIPDGTEKIDDYAFQYAKITEFTFPSSLKTIGFSAFERCNNLKNIVIPSTISSLGEQAFYGCSNLESAVLPDNITEIPAFLFAFCSKLKSVTLSPNTISIANGFVRNCYALTEIEIPATVTSIGKWAFCESGLKNVKSLMENPCAVDETTFGDITANATLYVPAGSKALYEAANYWKDFMEIVENVEISDAFCLYVTDKNALPGTKVLLPIELSNKEEVKLCQFDLQLPAGVTVATKSNGKLDAKLTERAETHSISSQQLNNGNYRFIISSMDNDSFTGNSGTLVEITLDIPETMEAGEYTVKLLNAELSVPDGTDLMLVKPADTESKLTIKAYTPGDVNNDGSVSVTDVGCAINYILEQVPSVFIFEAADMNGDKSVSVTDVGMIINLILNEGSAASPKLNRAAAGDANLTQQRTTDGYQLQLENKDAFIGFQMDLQVANNAAINYMKLIGGDDHLMTYRQLENGSYRVVCYSPTNSTFEGNEAGLLNITTTGDVTISNVRLTTADFNEVCLDAVSGGTTGITDVKELQGDELKVYSLDGRLCRTISVQQGENPLNGLKAGVYMIGNRKVVVR